MGGCVPTHDVDGSRGALCRPSYAAPPGRASRPTLSRGGCPAGLRCFDGRTEHPKGRGPQRRLGRQLKEVVEAVGGGYCRLQMPFRLARAARGTVTGHELGALEGGTSPFPAPLPTTRIQR